MPLTVAHGKEAVFTAMSGGCKIFVSRRRGRDVDCCTSGGENMAGYHHSELRSGPIDFNDARDIIAKSPMSVMQMVIIVITIALNALDGFDVASISYASPGIAKEWGIERGALGIVL